MRASELVPYPNFTSIRYPQHADKAHTIISFMFSSTNTAFIWRRLPQMTKQQHLHGESWRC